MHISNFDYLLPQELIATTPNTKRDHSKLLIVKSNQLADSCFNQITQHINPGDLVIFNNSRVVKARIFGHKLTGGKIEILIERALENGFFTAHVRANKTIKPGLIIQLDGGLEVEIIENRDGIFKLHAKTPINLFAYLEQFGNIPLPPYMNRQAVKTDSERYQTVYANPPGSVAAPTAGLHFTQELLNDILNKGAKIAYVTLHVGSGTFKPVSVENITEHKMHSEAYSIDQATIQIIEKTKANGGKIIAVGTTSLRTLETFAKNGYQEPQGETDIFITPGFKFKLVDKLITNFHLPKSTLLMLVSAFAGIETINKAYKHAIKHKYKFFSYGDAMLLECTNKFNAK